MKLRKIFLLLMLTLLFLGLSYATEVSNDTTNTVDTSIADTNDEVVQSSNMPIKEVENTITDEKNTKKEISKQYNDSVKTESSKTYDINDFDTLNSALMCDTYSTVTLNIYSDIRLDFDIYLIEAIEKLTINGNGKTIDGDNQCQFLYIGNSNAEVNINNIKITNCIGIYGGAIGNYGNLTITNGTLNNSTSKGDMGGAIYNYGNCIITDCTLNNNIANISGGAICNYGNLTIINTTINNNTSKYGGAIGNMDGTLIIKNSILNNNIANTSGGAIDNWCSLTVTNSTLNNNKVNGDGGAIGNYRILTITNSTLNNNTATEDGGAIHNENLITIINSTLNNNKVNGDGGAIGNYGTVTVINSILINNTAEMRGTIYNFYGELNISNSILNNNAAEKGGAIYNFIGKLNITNSTLNNNNAERGGAIYNHKGTLTITNSTLNNNNADVGGAIENHNGVTIIKNSTLNDNYAFDGSAIANNKGTVTLTDTVLNHTIGEETGLYNWKGTIAIYEYPTWIKLAYIGDVEYGSTVKVVARLFCNETTPLKYKWVNVTVNSNVYKVKSDGAGYIRLNFTANKYNTNKITVKYGGSSLYPASYIATTFDVKQPTWIKIASMSNVNYGSTVKVVARLFCNGTTALKYKTVNVTVNDKVYQVKSDGAGYIRLNYTVDNYDVQKISFKYPGSRVYLASSNSTTFNVKQPTWIKHAYVGTVKQGSTVKIVGRLLYNGTTSLKYKKVKVTVNDKVYTLKTDGAGYYRLNYTATTLGNVTFTSSFAGNSLYLSSSNSTTFTVVKS